MTTSHSPRASFPLGPFTPYDGNPILRPQGDSWESGQVYNPAALVVDDQVVLLYRAHANDIISHVGLAVSDDGLHFTREPDPVVFPEHDYERYGCEDPRVSLVNGTYYLTYTGWDRVSARLCLATSTDLRTWTKHGPLFEGFDTFFTTEDKQPSGTWSKAGVIVPEPIDGLYYMYFGEGAIYYATSTDLLNWTPCPQESPIYGPTDGAWDRTLVEVGPPPITTDNGLLLFLTNGARRFDDGSVDYRCGQILVNPAEPTKVMAKLMEPWLRPQTFEDFHGLISNVTFVEGLVWFRGRWLAYYGQSDTTLAVAIHDPDMGYAGPVSR